MATGASAFSCSVRATPWGWHRAHRLWRQAGLQLPRRRPRRRIATGRPRPLPAASANFVWAYDFVFDACANGQQLKCLTVVDEYTRECLAIDVAGWIRSAGSSRCWRSWSALTAHRATALGQRPGVRLAGAPRMAATGEHRHRPDRSRASPGRTAPNESFNGKFRDECLSVEWFRTHRGAGRDRELASSLQRGPTAQQPELLDPACLQAAASPFTPPSRPPDMNGSKKPRQVATNPSTARDGALGATSPATRS